MIGSKLGRGGVLRTGNGQRFMGKWLMGILAVTGY